MKRPRNLGVVSRSASGRGEPAGDQIIGPLVVTIVLGLTAGRSRWLARIIGGLLILGAGAALVVDGVHFPSDVIASIVWGIVIAPLARMIWVSIVLRGIDRARARRQVSSLTPQI